jgi:hypothetical protein
VDNKKVAGAPRKDTPARSVRYLAVRTGELEARHADLTKRLAAKQAEKDRYVRAYAQDHISEEELETYLLDLKNQIGNLRLLIHSVDADLSQSAEKKLAARSTEAWLLTLRERIAEVEEDAEEAFEKRRELAKLLVERIDVGRDEDGRARVRTTYRFGPPASPEPAGLGEEDSFAAGLQNSFRFRNGKVVEIWNHRDDLGLREQLGAPIFAGSSD